MKGENEDGTNKERGIRWIRIERKEKTKKMRGEKQTRKEREEESDREIDK